MADNRYSYLPASRRSVTENQRQTRSQNEPAMKTNDRTLDPPISTKPLRKIPLGTGSSNMADRTDSPNDLYDDPADELDRLEQSITLSLQQIDKNIAETVRVVSDKILPMIDRYSKASNGVWNGAKFWKQFFETSANVSLNAYSENVFDEENVDNTLQIINQAQEDRANNGEESSHFYQNPQANGGYEDEDDRISLGAKSIPKINIPLNDIEDLTNQDISIIKGSPRGKKSNFSRPYQMTPRRVPDASFLEEDSELFHNLHKVQQSTPRNQLPEIRQSHDPPILWQNIAAPLQASKSTSEKRFLVPQIRKNPPEDLASLPKSTPNNTEEEYNRGFNLDHRENSSYDPEGDISDLPPIPVLGMPNYNGEISNFKSQHTRFTSSTTRPNDSIDTSKNLPTSPVLKDSKFRSTPGRNTSDHNSTLPRTPSSIYPESATLFSASVSRRLNETNNTKDIQSSLFDSNLPEPIYPNSELRTPLNSTVRHQVLNQNWLVQASPVKTTPTRGNMSFAGLSRVDIGNNNNQHTPRRGENQFFNMGQHNSSILPSTPVEISGYPVTRKTPNGKIFYSALTPCKEPYRQSLYNKQQYSDNEFSSPPPMMEKPQLTTLLSPIERPDNLVNQNEKHNRESNSPDYSPVRKRKPNADTDYMSAFKSKKGKEKMETLDNNKQDTKNDHDRPFDPDQKANSSGLGSLSGDDELPAPPPVFEKFLKPPAKTQTSNNNANTDAYTTPQKSGGPDISGGLFDVGDDFLITPPNNTGSGRTSNLFKDEEERKRLAEKYGGNDDDDIDLSL
ncbi:hypothetical protein NADFUDRAFT_80300 [Nadsonia fulvescens var. elongata DSM 6958]|uniref:DASH complex subunit ASK1 n=1 Tax=Nadsonia fulvescens var. elongata DSM 6958 TaxID=857566 RepID=A0A1E3PDN2_9ASCO|nr:hypothetical protein NADFUDRAFT_80300 [Nadsonia fulvescens var. elongata DSM 6958]